MLRAARRPARLGLSVLFLATIAASAAENPRGFRRVDGLSDPLLRDAAAYGWDITPAQYDGVQRAIRDYEARARRLPAPDATRTASNHSVPADFVPYQVLPFAGLYDFEIWPSRFVDLDPTSGLLDWDCTEATYDGHQGQDYVMRFFGEQDIGVPIFAPLPGRVVETQDGKKDKNTEWKGQPANFVVLDHGGGQYGLYWHLKKKSVLVSEGQMVRAGQQLGLMGSSGNSAWPHLHLETRLDGDAVEPSSGRCNPGRSGWADQRKMNHRVLMLDFGFTHRSWESLKKKQRPPWAPPRAGQLGLDDPTCNFWFLVGNMPADATARAVFYRPDGTMSFDSGVAQLDNEKRQFDFWWADWEVPEMRRITGTWHVEVMINGKRLIRAPVVVRGRRSGDFNRPPAGPKKVSFDPKRPMAGAPVRCIARADPLLQDPDYDIVSNSYVWTLDGEIVRRITSAAMSDTLPADTGLAGQTLICRVTPTDGRLTGPAKQKKATLR